MTAGYQRPGDIARAALTTHIQRRNAELEQQFTFDALASGDAQLWKQARYWAKQNPAIAATIDTVQAGYVELGGNALDHLDTGTTDSAAARTTTASHDQRRTYLNAALAKRGLQLPDQGADAT